MYIQDSALLSLANNCGCEAAILCKYLIDRYNMYKKFNKLSFGCHFYITQKKVESAIGLSRRKYEAAIKLLASNNIISLQKMYNPELKATLTYVRFLNSSYIVGDAQNAHHPSEEAKCTFKSDNNYLPDTSIPSGADVQNEQQTNNIYNSNYIVVDNINNNKDIIKLSGNRLSEKDVKALLKECNNNLDIIKDKLYVAENQYKDLGKIKNLAGWLRDAIRNDYQLSIDIMEPVPEPESRNIAKVAYAFGIRNRAVTPAEVSNIRSWMKKTTLDNIIFACQKTLEMIAKPNYNYAGKVIESLASGKYREYNKKEKCMEYTEADYKIERELLGYS